MPDVRVPEGVVGGFEFAPDSGRLAFTLVGPTRNPDVWVLDLPEGEPRPVTLLYRRDTQELLPAASPLTLPQLRRA